MQTQDASAEFLFKLWPWLEANKNRLIGAVAALVVLAGILYFISSQKAQKEVDAGQELTAVTLTGVASGDSSQMADQFAQVAAKYPGTAAGQRAQLQAAGALFDAGKYPEAQAQFQKYMDGSSTGPLAATAQLGIAASLEAQNKLDEAAAAYQRVVSLFPDAACVPMAELSQGRIAEQQNKLTEAMNHYQDAARSPLGGSVPQEAMIRGSELKVKIAATTPKSPAVPAAAPAAAPAFTPMSLTPPASKP